MTISLEGDRIENADGSLSVRKYETPDTSESSILKKALAWLDKPWFLQRRFELVHFKINKAHHFVWINKKSFKNATHETQLTYDTFRSHFGSVDDSPDFLSTIQSCTKSPLNDLILQNTFNEYERRTAGDEDLPAKLEKKPNRLARSILFNPSTRQGILLMSSARSKGDKVLGKGSFKTAKYGINLRTGERVVVAITRIPKMPDPSTDNLDDDGGSYIELGERDPREIAAAERVKFQNTIDIVTTTIASEEMAASELVNVAGIVNVLFTSQGENKHYVVMQDYNKGNLYEALIYPTLKPQDKKAFTEEELVKLESSALTLNKSQKTNIAIKLLKALAGTHAKGILHRDIKLDNVFLDNHNSPVLADWGLACHDDDKEALKRVVGTKTYQAPETLRKNPLKQSKASDCYALGKLLFELFAPRVIDVKFNRSLKDILPTYKTRIPKNIYPVILGLLQTDPSNRMTAQAALDLLSIPRELGEAEIQPLEIED